MKDALIIAIKKENKPQKFSLAGWLSGVVTNSYKYYSRKNS